MGPTRISFIILNLLRLFIRCDGLPAVPKEEDSYPGGSSGSSLTFPIEIHPLAILIISQGEKVNSPWRPSKATLTDKGILDLKIEYKNYLSEVSNLLEKDSKLQKASQDNTDIWNHLAQASEDTRTRLDELKRIEIRRLKELHKQMMRKAAESFRKDMNGGGVKLNVKDLPKVNMEHLDDTNPHTFGAQDLEKLIKKTVADITKLDTMRRDNFKEYEMDKELKYKTSLEKMTLEERKAAMDEHAAKISRHAKHPKLHHPGSRSQLEEVWKKADLMNLENFDPKTFFYLHDIDGDGLLSTPEIEALFITELDKLYNTSNSDDDIAERNEEMNRMREHIFTEVDQDQDGMVSFQEFMRSTESETFAVDDGWQTIDETPQFTDEELAAFAEKQRQLNEEAMNRQ